MKTQSRAIIVDMVMGTGKTTMAIQGIKENEMPFIFVTEYLTEVDRMIKATGKLVEPVPEKGEGSKRKHLLELLKDKKNIALTHSLFKTLRLEDYSIFNGYKLIIDEVVSVVENLDISKDDINDLIGQNRLIIDSKNNTVTWNDDIEYSGKWNDLREEVLSGGVEIVNNSYLVWIFPVDVFKNVSEIIILTYLFEGSVLCGYFKYYDIPYRYIPDLFSDKERQKIVKLLCIYQGRANNVGNPIKRQRKRPLTSTWYKDNNNKAKIKTFVNTVNNWFAKNVKVKTANRAVSVFKDYEDMFSTRANFIPINKRASNEFREIAAIAYLIDYNINPTIEQFFLQKDIKIDKDLFSLSGMIQLLWRGCIRDDKKMDVFIPSFRMRNLLYKWLMIQGK